MTRDDNVVFLCPRVLTPRESFGPAVIRVSDGRVVAIEPASSGAERLSGTVVPGYIDLQVNGWGPRNVLEGSIQAIEDIALELLGQGVTAWLPTIVSCPADVRLAAIDAIAGAMDRQRRGVVGGARILGAHLEGPWIAAARAGAHDLDALEPPNALAIEQSLGRQPGVVRIVTLAPELPGGLDAVRRIVASGAIASIGHTDASFDEASEAFVAGASMATHLFNAMRPMHHREPGVIGAVLTDAHVVAGLIADGIHLHPIAVALVFRAKPERVALVSDVVAGEGPAGAASLPDGTLAGSLTGLWEGVARAVDVGVTMEDAVQAATLTPAELLRVRLGQLTPGAPADFVVLDAHLQPRATYMSGERVWSSL